MFIHLPGGYGFNLDLLVEYAPNGAGGTFLNLSKDGQRRTAEVPVSPEVVAQAIREVESVRSRPAVLGGEEFIALMDAWWERRSVEAVQGEAFDFRAEFAAIKTTLSAGTVMLATALEQLRTALAEDRGRG